MVQLILRDDDLNINCTSRFRYFFEASKYYDGGTFFCAFHTQNWNRTNNYIPLDFSIKTFVKKARNLLKIENVTLSMHGIN